MTFPKFISSLVFLILLLNLLPSDLILSRKAYAEGTYFYWNIESSRIWPSRPEGSKGSVLTEVPDVGETIQIQIFEEMVCRARIKQMIKPRFVAELMRIECSSDGYVTSTFMDVICEASVEYRKLRNRQMEFANRQKPLFRTRQEWNIQAWCSLNESSTPPTASDNSRLSEEDLMKLKDLDDFPRCCVIGG